MILTKQIGNYIIQSDGKVITYNPYLKSMYGKVMKTYTHPKNGYQSIDLRIDKKHKRYLLHRLIAECFIPNPQNKPEVNHMDGDKTNNDISNLEWATHSENGKHSYRVLGRKISGAAVMDWSGKNNPMYGKTFKMTDEHKEKIGKAIRGKKRPDVSERNIQRKLV